MSFLSRFSKPKRPKDISQLGRNDLCWCGSGKKYKRCHYDSDGEYRSLQKAATVGNGSGMPAMK